MDVETIQADQVLDTSGLTCPMPLLKAKKTMKGMESGQTLEIIGTDPGSKNDIPDYCNKGKAEFLGMEDKAGGRTHYYIRIK
ncbi:MAG: sulfurtransferase TusA family protein [Desulfohalobiaceae bacterium]|nr:sulfurtransferase TusA family protein [Desulfohalobiaceae bacterium]